VSYRAVHWWSAGGAVNTRHRELVAELRDIVAGLPAPDAASRRALMFAPRPGAASIFDDFIRRHRVEGGYASEPPYPFAALFGAY
jgi:hypothetical protein